MKTRSLASSVVAVALVACGGAVGCGAAIDSSGLGDDGGASGDGGTVSDVGSDQSTTDASMPDTTPLDGGAADGAPGDATPTDSGPSDDGTVADVTPIDATSGDVTAIDATLGDATGGDSGAIDATSGDVGAIDAGAVDVGTVDASSDVGVTLLDVCTLFADAVCGSQLESCCSAHGVAYAASGCQTNALFLCNSWVDRVNAGTSTFDPTALSACIAGWQAAEAKCDVPNQDFAQDYVPCDQLFNGTVAPGGTCTADGDCKAAPGSFVACETVGSGKQCVENTFPTTGGACTFTGSPREICVDGDYCPGFGATGIGAKCAVATPIGSACANALDASCGIGNHCAPGSTPLSFVCAPGLGSGATCTSFADCASLTCTSGKCTDPDAHLASAGLCGG